ncbi:tRNA (adenosine(37)-N6)-dimethylallyltransferase MiaA [Ilumatobacter nonamiensis]|uniref:tRNA (adenosine(37)-N6)-dimethylallyltransferase MiaA n=1 Tax=Ilumatobacter nonamiensis TaxID=467093 RepID=UPI00034C8698|nr:tRNA (adenosine(37)-N6)-dimethylallyltransferase MiaA [Ilumatobacter nonamiensis]
MNISDTGPIRVAIVGSTASGKSDVAMAVARELGDVELVSVDSMQVYRGMDIGTAKPTAAERAEVVHHCINLVAPTDEFTVGDFQPAYRAAIDHARSRSHRALLVGGTGLYHRVVIDDFELPGEFPEVRAELEAEPDTVGLHARLATLDPAAAGKMEPENRRRVVRALEVTLGSGRPFSDFGPGVDAYPPTPVTQIGLRRPRPVIAERIERRVAAMIDAGLIDEVRELMAAGFSRSAGQALGYKEIVAYLDGRIGKDEAIETIITRTRQFAVRQERWFRRDPRVQWIDVDHDPVAEVAPAVIHALHA